MHSSFFRAGVGAVIVDADRRILVLRRTGATDGAWQLPQGGIEESETPEEALYRELHEEVGLSRADIEIVRTAADWLAYELPAQYRNEKVGMGQVHRWHLCRLLVPRDVVNTDQVEFTQARWVTADELVSHAVSFRVRIYQRLVAEFEL